MNAEMNQGYTATLSASKRLDDSVLDKSRRPPDMKDGMKDMREVKLEAKKSLIEDNMVVVIWGGPPASGKSRSDAGMYKELSEDADVQNWMDSTGKKTIRKRSLIWIDYLELGKDTGLIAPTRTADDITTEDATVMTYLMLKTAHRLVNKYKRINQDKNSESFPDPVYISLEAPLLPGSSRGFSAAQLLVNETNALVVYSIGNKEMQEDKPTLRKELEFATVETIIPILDRNGIDHAERNPRILLKQWSNFGATEKAIYRINSAMNNQLYDLKESGELIYPKYRRNKKVYSRPPFSFASPDDFNMDLNYRAELIALNFFPAGIREIGIPTTRTYISINAEQERIVDERSEAYKIGKRLVAVRNSLNREVSRDATL